jgi:hypothetical protein
VLHLESLGRLELVSDGLCWLGKSHTSSHNLARLRLHGLIIKLFRGLAERYHDGRILEMLVCRFAVES